MLVPVEAPAWGAPGAGSRRPHRDERRAEMSDSEELVQDRRDPLLVLRLNRPEARNALTATLLSGIGAAIARAEADPGIRAIVLTGTGERAFCAGMDLRSFAAGEEIGVGASEDLDAFHRLLRGEVAIPVIGAANGTAIAGGLELLLGCDVIVASCDARFGLPEVKRGLFAGGNGTALGTRIPLAVALEISLTGDLIDAARAHDLCLINAVVAPEKVLDAAIEMGGTDRRQRPPVPRRHQGARPIARHRPRSCGVTTRPLALRRLRQRGRQGRRDGLRG